MLFLFKALFQLHGILIYKDNFEILGLLQTHIVGIDSESGNPHAGGEWEMVTKMKHTKPSLGEKLTRNN